jgi:hypothetical protein
MPWYFWVMLPFAFAGICALGYWLGAALVWIIWGA